LLWGRLWGGNKAEDARAVVADGDSIIYVVGSIPVIVMEMAIMTYLF